MKGLEIAWRTLAREALEEPCIVASWLMKGSYYSRVTGRDYWASKDAVFLDALPRMGVNLCPQWAFPYDAMGNASGDVSQDPHAWVNRYGIRQPEEILPLIDRLPTDESLEREFDLDAYAQRYAGQIKSRIDATGGAVLFIDSFDHANFTSPYNDWGYIPYLMAMSLYPDHIQRYYHYTATYGRLTNMAIVEAVRRYGLAPYVYSGEDICANHGPLCSLATLDRLYFPELRRSIQPLLDGGVKIIWHCDGNIMPILDRLIDLGVSGLQGFQEETGVPFDHLVNVRTKWGEPLILWGCVSVTTTLPFGTVEDVQAAVRRSFTLAGPGRGFALASTSSIMPEVPDENIAALYSYGQEFGRRFLRDGALN